jgi:hypothetical protein
VEKVLDQNEVAVRRLKNSAISDKGTQKAEQIWWRDLLKTWFCKQFSNRRIERLKAAQGPKVSHCMDCGSQLICLTCENKLSGVSNDSVEKDPMVSPELTFANILRQMRY